MANNGLYSLRNDDYADRELCLLIDDLADADGWATTEEIAERVAITSPKDRPTFAVQCVAGRCTWMVRYGYFERDEEHGRRWRLTPVGEMLGSGKLSRSVKGALEKMSDGDRLLVIRALTEEYHRQDPGSIAMRRQWQHSTRQNGNRRTA